MTEYRIVESPIGKIVISAENGCIIGIRQYQPPDNSFVVSIQCKLLDEASKQMYEYFTHKRTRFDLPLHLDGTLFQNKIWTTLQSIPYGETRTYGEIAELAGYPKAARAVGKACGQNPILIILPCHRVIGASGALTGFSGGLESKKILLSLEKS